MATLETSLEANYERQADGQKKRLIGARATALPKNPHIHMQNPGMIWAHVEQDRSLVCNIVIT